MKKGTLAKYRWSDEDGWELHCAVGSEDCGRGTRRNPKGTVGALVVERPRRKQRPRQAEPQFDFEFDNPDLDNEPGHFSSHGHSSPLHDHEPDHDRERSSPIRSDCTSPTRIETPFSPSHNPALPDPPSPSRSARSRTSLSSRRHSTSLTPTRSIPIASKPRYNGLDQSLNHGSPTSTIRNGSTRRDPSTSVDPPFSAEELHSMLEHVVPRIQWDPRTLAQLDYLHELINKGLNIEATESGDGDGDRES